MALACDSRTDRGGLVKYLLTMVGTLCNDTKYFQGCEYENMVGKIGFMPISYIAQEAGVSEQTAITYNGILEKNGIMYIYHFNHSFYDEGYREIRSMNNVYGLIEDKYDVAKYARGAAAKYGIDFKGIKNDDADKRRSLGMKFNAMRKGKVYSPEETKEIYDYVVEFNKNAAIMNKRGYRIEFKDESVFEGVI